MPKKEATKRKLQAEKSRNEIYDAAIELIRTTGFERTTIQAIIAKAGVSIGTFYHHFKSKDGIIEENFLRADALFTRYLEEEPAESREAPSTERILRYMDRYALLVRDVGVDLSQQLYTCRNKLFLKEGRPMQVGLARIVAEGQARGDLIDTKGAAEICSYLFIAARGLVFDWCLRDGKGDIEAELRSFLAPLVGLFARDGGRARG